MKNHMKVQGKLLQTNKKYGQLKQKQKEWIGEELYQLYRNYVLENGKFPSKEKKRILIDTLYEKIKEREIWIPYSEVFHHMLSKTHQMKKRLKKEGILEESFPVPDKKFSGTKKEFQHRHEMIETRGNKRQYE